MPRQTVLRRAIILSLVVVGLNAEPAHAALTLTTDHRSVSFGLMQLDEEKTLAEQGSFHNQITCASTGGRLWYLKIHVLQPLTAGAETVPLEAFKWAVTTPNGKGNVAHSNQLTPFNVVPDLVYISGANEAAGTTVTFQFRYSLKVPSAQLTGVYNTTIRFTFTEIL